MPFSQDAFLCQQVNESGIELHNKVTPLAGSFARIVAEEYHPVISDSLSKALFLSMRKAIDDLLKQSELGGLW